LAALLLVLQALPRRSAPSVPVAPPGRPEIADWANLASIGHRRGSDRPLVQVVMFSDLLCQYCAQQALELEHLVARYPDDVAVIYRHYPGSDRSYALAVAMECSGNTTERLAFADKVFANRRAGSAPP